MEAFNMDEVLKEVILQMDESMSQIAYELAGFMPEQKTAMLRGKYAGLAAAQETVIEIFDKLEEREQQDG